MRESRDVLTALEKNYPNADLADAKTLRDARVRRARAARRCRVRGGDLQRSRIATTADRTRGRRAATSSQGATCSEDDDDERVVALNALLQMDADRAMPILKKVLERRDACSYVLRRKAVFLVSQKGGEEAADILMQTAKNDPDQRDARAGSVLARPGPVRPRRRRCSRTCSRTRTTRRSRTRRCSRCRSTAARVPARSCATSPSARARTRSCASRRSSGSARSAPRRTRTTCKALYSRVKTDALKEKIIFSLSQQRGFGNAEWIMDIALDPKESIEMRKQALFWAGQNGGASTESFASAVRQDDGPRDQGAADLRALAARSRRQGVDKLMDIAKNDKDKELRKQGGVLARPVARPARGRSSSKTSSRRRSSRRRRCGRRVHGLGCGAGDGCAAPRLGAQSLADRVSCGARGHGADDVRLASRCVRRRRRRHGVRQAVHGVSVNAGPRVVERELHVRPRPRRRDAARWRGRRGADVRRRAPSRRRRRDGSRHRLGSRGGGVLPGTRVHRDAAAPPHPRSWRPRSPTAPTSGGSCSPSRATRTARATFGAPRCTG